MPSERYKVTTEVNGVEVCGSFIIDDDGYVIVSFRGRRKEAEIGASTSYGIASLLLGELIRERWRLNIVDDSV